jgi:N-acetyl-gamma-glutamyl-phosphate reductase
MVRGIHATCSARLCSKTTTTEQLLESLRKHYATEPFVEIVETPPGTKAVRGSNNVMIGAAVDRNTNRAIVVSVIDNLTKGAAGQAVQNMNIALQFDEHLAVPLTGLYP